MREQDRKLRETPWKQEKLMPEIALIGMILFTLVVGIILGFIIGYNV